LLIPVPSKRGSPGLSFAISPIMGEYAYMRIFTRGPCMKPDLKSWWHTTKFCTELVNSVAFVCEVCRSLVTKCQPRQEAELPRFTLVYFAVLTASTCQRPADRTMRTLSLDVSSEYFAARITVALPPVIVVLTALNGVVGVS
jgi:hypothetical protein